jgi:hypothetical protein
MSSLLRGPECVSRSPCLTAVGAVDDRLLTGRWARLNGELVRGHPQRSWAAASFTVRPTMFRRAFLLRPSRVACLAVATAAVALVAGCTMGWVRPSTTAEQTRNDSAECAISAAGKYPPNIIKAGSLRPGEPSIDTDANELLRDEEAKYCMRHNGYEYTRAP